MQLIERPENMFSLYIENGTSLTFAIMDLQQLVIAHSLIGKKMKEKGLI